MMEENFSIRKTSRSTPPRIPFKKIATSLLGTDFSLSLVFIGDSLARSLNKTYRGKTYAANVLTFPLTKNSGELFINLHQAKKEARKYGIPYRTWVLRLFIHGLLHLEGMRHGATMEAAEEKLVTRFS